MRRPFIGSERDESLEMLVTVFSHFLNHPTNKMVVNALIDHLRDDHGHSPEEALSELATLQARALRQVADNLEEKASELLTAIKEVKM